MEWFSHPLRHERNPVARLALDPASELELEQHGQHDFGRQLALANQFVNRYRGRAELFFENGPRLGKL